MDGLIALSLANNYTDSVGDEIKSSKKLVIPDGTTVVTAAMVPDRDIECVELPGSVARIDDEAFMNCKYLKLIYVNQPSDEKIEIGRCAFLGCTNLETFVGQYVGQHSPFIEIALKNVAESAFEGCVRLNSLILLSGNVGARAFLDCAHLTCCFITEADLIGDSAFHDCINLNCVVFGNCISVDIDASAFDSCVNLKNLSFELSAINTIGERSFKDCWSLEQIGMELVQSIDHDAFRNSGIKYLVIPDSVTTIASSNFIDQCDQLTDIIIKGTPDICDLDSYAIISRCLRIYVREDNLSFFQNHQLWSVIYNMGIIVKTEDYLDYLLHTKGINLY